MILTEPLFWSENPAVKFDETGMDQVGKFFWDFRKSIS